MSNKRTSICKCTGVTVGKSKNGHDQVIINLEVVEGDRLGEKLAKWCYATESNPDSKQWIVDDLRICGWTNNSISNPEGLGTTKFKVVEVEETYEGKTSFKVKYINKMRKELTPQEAEEVDDMFAAYAVDSPLVEVTDENRVPVSDNY